MLFANITTLVTYAVCSCMNSRSQHSVFVTHIFQLLADVKVKSMMLIPAHYNGPMAITVPKWALEEEKC